jgi:antitoxin MazE
LHSIDWRDYNVITQIGLPIVKTKLVRIGNSRGIRIPKPLIEQCGLEGTVELSVENDRLVVSPGRSLRHGWAEAFTKAGSSENDELLLGSIEGNEFDRSEWKW